MTRRKEPSQEVRAQAGRVLADLVDLGAGEGLALVLIDLQERIECWRRPGRKATDQDLRAAVTDAIDKVRTVAPSAVIVPIVKARPERVACYLAVVVPAVLAIEIEHQGWTTVDL